MKCGWAGLVVAKIKLILANDIPSKKMKDGWAELVLAKGSHWYFNFKVPSYSSLRSLKDSGGPIVVLFFEVLYYSTLHPLKESRGSICVLFLEVP